MLDGAHVLHISIRDIVDVVFGENAFGIERFRYVLVVPVYCPECGLIVAHGVDVSEIVPRKDPDKVIVKKLWELFILLELQNTHDSSHKITDASWVVRVGHFENSEWDL